MPSHSEGPGIWLSVWRFLLTHCLYERTTEVLARLCGCACSPEPSLLAQTISNKFAWRGPSVNQLQNFVILSRLDFLCCFFHLRSTNSMSSHQSVWPLFQNIFVRAQPKTHLRYLHLTPTKNRILVVILPGFLRMVTSIYMAHLFCPAGYFFEYNAFNSIRSPEDFSQ